MSIISKFHDFERSLIQRNLNLKKELLEYLLNNNVRVIKTVDVLNESSNSENFAKRELDLLIRNTEKNGDTHLVKEFIPEILSLIDKFGNSGQSGGSAPYTAGAIISVLKDLLMFKPLCPITGEDHEWNDTTSMGSDDKLLQNNRCSAVFKEPGGNPYYIDAVVFKTDKGHTWTGSAKLKNGEKVYSSQEIKNFPFTPKTFVVDIDEVEIAPDDWEFYIKDEDQLVDVFNYYNKLSR